MDQAGEHRLGDHVACHGPPLLQVPSIWRATLFGPSHELLPACTWGEQECCLGDGRDASRALPAIPHCHPHSHPSREAYPDSRRPAAGGGSWRCTGRRWWGPAWPTATAPSCRLCLQSRGQIKGSPSHPKLPAVLALLLPGTRQDRQSLQLLCWGFGAPLPMVPTSWILTPTGWSAPAL